MEILKLRPTGKDYSWSRTRLKEEYNKRIDMMLLSGDTGVFRSPGWAKHCSYRF